MLKTPEMMFTPLSVVVGVYAPRGSVVVVVAGSTRLGACRVPAATRAPLAISYTARSVLKGRPSFAPVPMVIVVAAVAPNVALANDLKHLLPTTGVAPLSVKLSDTG